MAPLHVVCGGRTRLHGAKEISDGGHDNTATQLGKFAGAVGKTLRESCGHLTLTRPMGERSMPGYYFVDEAGCTEKNFKAWRGQ